MDKDLLVTQGFNPQKIEAASLSGYRLVIGERATLSRQSGTQAFGVVMQLAESELQTLYSGGGVEDYVPEWVTLRTGSGRMLEAVVYVLPTELISGSNSAYASQLVELAHGIGLPEFYITEIEQWM